MVRDFRPWRHAQGRHRQTEHRNRCCIGDGRGPGAAGYTWHRADCRRTRSAGRADQVRSGDLGAGRCEVRYGEGVTDMSTNQRKTLAVRALATGLVAVAVAFASAAVAADWPARPVSIVVPYAPGGGTDIMARLIAQRLTEKHGKPFIVDNRGGASGTIGTGYVRAAADGYTLLYV